MANKKICAEIDKYIDCRPKKIQRLLKQLRTTVRKAAPSAKENISYRIPTFDLNGNLVHFAAFTNHIGFYPTSSGIKAFKKDLSAYKTSKGAIQFRLDEPLPLDLVSRIVKFRVREQLKKENGVTSRAAALQVAKISIRYLWRTRAATIEPCPGK